MPPPLAGPAPAVAPPGDPGAVESGGAGGMPGPQAGQGMLPPSANPMPQNAPPQGNEALGVELARRLTGYLHYVRMLFAPTSKFLKTLDKAFNTMQRDFQPDSDAMKQGPQMPPGITGGPRGGAQGGPPGIGAGPGAMPPPSPPRGPIPMPAQGGAP